MKVLQDLAIKENASLISITESHLKPCITDGEIHVENYVPFRTDRANDRKKGGVVNYIRKDLSPNTSMIASYSNEYTELQILYFKTENLLFATFYRPPNCPSLMFRETLNILEQQIVKFDSPVPNIMIIGDFNFPFIDWTTDVFRGGNRECHNQAEAFIEFSNEHCLKQHIQNSTRENNILDLLFTNNEDFIHRIDITDTALSDHRLITIQSNVFGKRDQVRRDPNNFDLNDVKSYKNLNFFHKNTNWSVIRQELSSVRWNAILSSQNPEEMYHTILETCLKICVNYVPQRRNKRKSLIPRDRKILMNKRSKLKRKLLLENNIQKVNLIQNNIEAIEMTLQTSHENEKKLQENIAVAAIKSNPKYFYAYAKRTSKLKSKIGPLTINDVVIHDSLAMSEALSNQYTSVFSTPSQVHKVQDPRGFFSTSTQSNPKFDSLIFSKENVVDAIKEIANNSASGPDNFPAILLKNCAEELSPPLYILWSASMATGVIPKQLKTAIITPIFKGGPRDQPKNYRPVALTSHIIKVFEKVVVKNLTSFLESHNYMNENQHGFRSKRSCLSQLLAHYENILSALEHNRSADVIYLDFAKAFDKVDHGILMHKMKSFGITGQIAIWIHNFLSGRRQQVAVDNTISSESPVISGVPQGTVLGPLLFLILISDINQNVRYSTVSSFADDTRVFKEISTHDDCMKLQNDLQHIYNWASENNMCFNSCKFEKLHYSHRKESINVFNYTSDDNNVICDKQDLRDLGVTMSNDATFRTHINTVTKASRSKLGWILRTFQTREKLPMLTLWKSLVIPILDYCSQLWSPLTVKDIQLIESVQRTFTAKIISIRHLNYWERLKHLKLYSLERRRERYIIMYVWKMINHMVPNIGIETKTGRLGRKCRVRGIYPQATNRIKTICSASLRVRGCQLFNELPMDIRELKDVDTNVFKKRLDAFLATVPDEPTFPGYTSRRAASNTLLDQLSVKKIDRINSVPSTGAAPAGPTA